MTKEEKFLVDVCNAYLADNRLDIPDDIHFNELYRIAKHHNLLSICHCVLNKQKDVSALPQDFLNAVKNNFFDSIYVYELQKNCLDELEAILTASQIRYILFKGILLRELYPVPESRTMGDIDVLIDPSNKDSVKKLLINAGYDCSQHDNVYSYQKNGVMIEVHTRLISEFGDEAFNDAFDNASFKELTGVFNDSYHAAYIIAHIAHHFIDYGAGIRHILDLAVMQKKKNIDIDTVIGILKPIKLDTFAKVILSVCSEWFGEGAKLIEDTQKTQDFICTCGAFGNLRENTGVVVSRRILQKNKNLSSFKIKMYHAFPSYERMRHMSYINFVDGKPWLTPYAWCYRIFYNLKNRRTTMMKTVNEIDNKQIQKLAKQELAYFEEIGLI